MRGRLGENSVMDTRLWTWALTPKTISSVTPRGFALSTHQRLEHDFLW